MMDNMDKWDSVPFDTEKHAVPPNAEKKSFQSSRPSPAAAPVPPTLEKGSSMEISVGEPVKHGDGINAYISYKITTKTERPTFKNRQFSVIRRFSDFVWLHETLAAHYPGIVIPPLPEKILVGRFSPDFIESRRRSLEKFLNRTATHPELSLSEQFRVFIEADEGELNTFKLKKGKSSRANSGWFQWLDETVQSISTSLGGGSSLEKTTADLEFDEVNAYMEGLDPLMQNLFKHAQGLVKRNRETAEGLFEFGVAFTLLGQNEGQSIGDGLAKVGKCADQLSVLTAEQAEKEALFLEEPMQDYVRLVSAVKNALLKRSEARATYESAVADLEAKRAAVDKLISQRSQGAAVRDDKIAAAEAEVKKAKQRTEEIGHDLEKITDRVMQEVERFKSTKVADFRNLILDYVTLQIEYNRKIEEAWEAIIPELEAIEIEPPSAATPESSATM